MMISEVIKILVSSSFLFIGYAMLMVVLHFFFLSSFLHVSLDVDQMISVILNCKHVILSQVL